MQMQRRMLAGIVLSIGLLAVFMVNAPANPASAALPPRPGTPVAQEPDPSEPRGAWITVRVWNATSQSVVVQWRDGEGAWHDVGSWRGEFDRVVDKVGIKTWWLEERLFGAPGFRWSVFDKASGKVVGESAVFAMPEGHNQTVTVDVTVP